MTVASFRCLALSLVLGAPLAHAADDAAFQLRTAADLARLCAVPADNPRHPAAVHMCQGYLVGVHHLHAAALEPSETGGLYCLPETPPSRNDAAAAFAEWVGTTPGAGDLPTVEGVMRWAAATYPCR
jgi:hypothetical protein